MCSYGLGCFLQDFAGEHSIVCVSPSQVFSCLQNHVHDVDLTAHMQHSRMQHGCEEVLYTVWHSFCVSIVGACKRTWTLPDLYADESQPVEIDQLNSFLSAIKELLGRHDRTLDDESITLDQVFQWSRGPDTKCVRKVRSGVMVSGWGATVESCVCIDPRRLPRHGVVRLSRVMYMT